MPRSTTCPECGRTILRVSWSQVRTAEECRQKAHLSRTGRKQGHMDVRNFFPGNVTDRVVRYYLEGNDHSPGVLKSMVESVMNNEQVKIIEGRDDDPSKKVEPGIVKWRDPGDRDRVLRDCEEAAEKIEPLLFEHVLPYRFKADFKVQAQLEIPSPFGADRFEMIDLFGYIDILVKDDFDRLWVFDVKHTKDDGYWRKTIGQLTFYDLALLSMLGEKTAGTALFQPLCKKPTHPHQVDDQARVELLQRIVNYSHSRMREDFTPRDDRKECGFCEYKHACVLYKTSPVDEYGQRRVRL